MKILINIHINDVHNNKQKLKGWGTYIQKTSCCFPGKHETFRSNSELMIDQDSQKKLAM